MKGPELLQQHTDIIRSRMGGVIPGVRAVFRGYDLHKDLKDIDWFDLYVLSITGRRLKAAQLKLLQAMWVYTSYPDARVWNNRVAALAGTSRSTGNLGLSAALAVSEAGIYGRGVDIRAISFLLRTKLAVDNGAALGACVQAELKTYRSIAGYGRPITSGDERRKPLMALAESLGLNNGPYISLSFDVEKYLLEGRWRMHMNYGALCAAFAADLGFSEFEYYRFAYLAFFAGMQPCFIEAVEKKEGTFLPLSCAHISYEGPAKRAWPKK